MKNQAKSLAEIRILTEINQQLKEILDIKPENFQSLEIFDLEVVPSPNIGDYSVPCFTLAKALKKSPVEISSLLAKNFKQTELISRVQSFGPYLNIFLNPTEFSRLVLSEIYKLKEKYGSSKIGKGKKLMVEFFSPNTNKPLTIGHIRNICLGASISKILKCCGYKIINSTLYNDRGIAIAKTIVGYKKWGEKKTPKQVRQKPDHFVGSFYVKFCQEEKNDPNLENEAKRALQEWEKGKREIKSVWQKLMGWVLEGFKQTLEKLEIKNFDEEYYESEYYNKGKEIVEQGLKKGIFIKNQEGVILAKLEKLGIPDKIVLRPDETSLYITQDLYLAYLKDKNNLDGSIYVVGSEQDLYFKQLFKILELLDFKNIDKYNHLSYGMIRLLDGKIKSREGVVKGTGADDLICQLEKLALKEIENRYPDLSDKELKKRSAQIALAALKFYILAVNPKTTMIFEPQKSISLTGKTGPYLQYVNARINSIFEKNGKKISAKVDFSLFKEQPEFELIKILAKFPNVIYSSALKYDPSDLTNYLYDLAKSFSSFYEKIPVIQAEKQTKKARLFLINNVKIVLKTGLDLLGIPIPEKM